MVNYLHEFKYEVRISPSNLWQVINEETEDAPPPTPPEKDEAGKTDLDSQLPGNSGHRALGKGLDPELWAWGKEIVDNEPVQDDEQDEALEEGPALAPPSIDWSPPEGETLRLKLVKRDPDASQGKDEEALRLSMDGLIFTVFVAAGVEAVTLNQKIEDALLITITSRPQSGSSVSGYYRSELPQLAAYLQKIGEWVREQDVEILPEDVPSNPQSASRH